MTPQPFSVTVHWTDELGHQRHRSLCVTARHIDEACDKAERLVRNTLLLAPRGVWSEAEGAVA